MSSDALLRIHGVSKSFPGVRALDRVDFTLRAGEIHALMGENGAGKSTLIKTLTGVHPPDEGEIFLDGLPIRPSSPRAAEALGVSTVYQEINLIPHLSIAENVTLGRQPTRFGLLAWRAIRDRARRALGRLGLDLDARRELASCSIAIQQMVAIARAIDLEARALVLDEPTSSLDEREVAELFKVMRALRSEGLGIIFITHFIEQVFAIADRTTVLRNGKRVGEYETAKLTRLELVSAMLGRQMESIDARDPAARSEPAAGERRAPTLAARGLGRRGSIAPFDLQLRAGEPSGLAGLLGSGRTETARLLFGIDRADSGSIEIEGRAVPIRSPREAVARGLAFCPEDRKADGIAPNLSVRENIVLALQARRGLRRIPPSEQRRIAEDFIRALDIRAPDASTPVGRLSGGNQQKVMLARWLAVDPRVVILDEPTRGIDIGAKAEIERWIARMCAEGRAVLFISSELEEVVRVCRRVAVLRDRAKIAELEGDEIDERAIVHLIASSA
jgi:simple sugar transport system ATP-binding protein